MKKLIEKLTPEQEVELKEFYQEQLEIGRSIKPIDHEKAEAIITKFYAHKNFARPNFHYYKSPHEVLTKHKEVKLTMFFGGQQWLYWKAFYKFGEKIGVVYDPKNLELLNDWVEETKHLHWWAPFETDCLIIERPIKLNVNEGGFLHCENDKAIEYADGWGLYYLNGVKVNEYLVMTPSEQLDINVFLKETNADVKAEFVRKYGVERMLHLGKKIDSYTKYSETKYPWWHRSQYELWDMKSIFPGLDYQPFLKMLNQTTGIWHMEAVSPECRSLTDALKERFGGKNMEIIGIA
jgi:hypothetical protein